jgi:hypothetical protein
MPVHHLLKPDIGRIIVLGGLQSGPLYQSVNSARTEVTGRALNRGEGEERVCARHARQNFPSQDADHRRAPLRESPRKKRPRAGVRRVSPMRSTEADWSTPHCPGVRLTSDQSSSGEGGRHHCECRNAAEAVREILRQHVPINEVSRKDFPFSECHFDRLHDR